MLGKAQRLPGVPAASGNLNFTFPIERWHSEIRWQNHFALAVDNVQKNIQKVPGYITVDLAYTWRPQKFKNLELIFAVNNLFNRYYQVYDGNPQTLPQMGRSIMLTASYRL